MPSQMNFLIKVNQIYNPYNDIKYNNIEFNKTSINTIIGRSGIGKSTFIKTILGINDLECDIEYYTNNTIGYVAQDRGLFNNKTVYDNLTIIYKIQKLDINYQLIDSYIDLFKLNHLKDKKVCEISGGEKTKLSIIRSLLSDSEVIILDEPLSNIDEISKQELIKLFIKLKVELNLCLIIISHDLNDIIKASDQILIFNDQGITKTNNENDHIKDLF